MGKNIDDHSPVSSRKHPRVGDHVLYVMDNGQQPGAFRPAVITEVIPEDVNDRVNLIVFPDGANDYPFRIDNAFSMPLWKCGIVRRDDGKFHNSYHYPSGDQ